MLKSKNLFKIGMFFTLLFSVTAYCFSATFNAHLEKLYLISEGKIEAPELRDSLLKSVSPSGVLPMEVHVYGKGNHNAVTALGGNILMRRGNYFTAFIPTSNLGAFKEEKSIEFMHAGGEVKTLLNNAGNYISLNQSYYGGYRGNGVIIGIIDTGIDLAHPDFLNENGLTRIYSVWDQASTEGSAPEGFDYGTLWTKRDIDNGVATQEDVYLHGTHVAGIAAGNGAASNGKYRGVSPEANIIVVKTDLSSIGYTLDAIDYIFYTANRLGLPAVINISLGTQDGNHKANDPFNAIADYIVDYYENKGRIIVWAAGNDGHLPFHTTNTIIADEICEVELDYNNGSFHIKFFYKNNEFIPVSVKRGASTIIPFTTQPTSSGSGAYMQMGNYADTGDKYVYIRISDFAGDWRVEFDGSSANSDIKLFGYVLVQDKDKISGFKNPVYDGTICTTASQSKAIAVGAMVTRPAYTNSQQFLQTDNRLTNENIAYFSSRGPTADNQQKPEVSAPGSFIISALSKDASPETKFIINNYYAALQGTSMAAPVVAGFVAQMLEKEPNLTVEEVRERLIYHVRGNQYKTNPGMWDSSFGYGIVDAMKLMEYDAETQTFDVVIKNNVLNTSSQTDNRYSLIFRSNHSQINKTLRVGIFDLRGNAIRPFEEKTIYGIEAEKYEWDGTDIFGKKVPAGVYNVTVQMDNNTTTYPVLVVY